MTHRRAIKDIIISKKKVVFLSLKIGFVLANNAGMTKRHISSRSSLFTKFFWQYIGFVREHWNFECCYERFIACEYHCKSFSRQYCVAKNERSRLNQCNLLLKFGGKCMRPKREPTLLILQIFQTILYITNQKSHRQMLVIV